MPGVDIDLPVTLEEVGGQRVVREEIVRTCEQLLVAKGIPSYELNAIDSVMGEPVSSLRLGVLGYDKGGAKMGVLGERLDGTRKCEHVAIDVLTLAGF